MASSQLIARHARETSERLAPAAHFAKFESCCVDRLARSIGDLQDIVRTRARRAALSLKATEQPIDTGTATGKCFLDMPGVFAEFETSLRRESRQARQHDRQIQDASRDLHADAAAATPRQGPASRRSAEEGPRLASRAS
jgi:hypothetical protein